MEHVSSFIPKPIGLNQVRILIRPIILGITYYGILLLQTRIKDEDNEGAIGFVFYFTRSRPSSLPYRNALISNYIIVILFAAWIAILTIKENGNLGNVTISSFIFGIIYFFMDLLFYIYYVLEDNKSDSWDSESFLTSYNFFRATVIFNVIEFMVISIVMSGIYFELIKHDLITDQVELYPPNRQEDDI